MDGMGFMGRNSYQGGKTIEKAENFVTSGPLGPLKVVLTLCFWYQIHARYVLDPIGIYTVDRRVLTQLKRISAF